MGRKNTEGKYRGKIQRENTEGKIIVHFVKPNVRIVEEEGKIKIPL